MSVGALLFLLSSSFFFSHPEPCLKMSFFVGKSDVLGRGLGWEEGAGEGKTIKTNEEKTGEKGEIKK